MDFSFSYNDYFSLLKNLPFFLQGVSSISRSWVDLMSTVFFFFSCLFLNIKLYSMKMWNYWYMRWTPFMQANVFYDDIYKWNSLLQIPKACLEKSSQFMVFYLKAHMWKAMSTHFHNKYNELSTTVWNQTSAVSSLRTQNKKQQQKTMP